MRLIRKWSWFHAFTFAGLSALSAFMLLPIVYIFNHAFKPFHELFLFPPTIIVREPTLSNFAELFSVAEDAFIPVTRYIFNTAAVTVAAVLLMIATSALCAYPLSKHKFPGKDLLFSAVIVSLLFVSEVLAIPRYMVMHYLGLKIGRAHV